MEFSKKFKNSELGFSSETVAGLSEKSGDFYEITVDSSNTAAGENSVFKGLGCISGNNSSRLLLDYKHLHPEIYQQILRLLFEKNYGASLSHLKLEMGADINSSSGTEPATMRSSSEIPDVTRGAGFILAADALKINPELTVDLLRWGEPRWVRNAFEAGKENGFEARYKWYADTIREAYGKFGIKFTHISPDANETGDADSEWLIYFAQRLKSEKNAPYDFGSIKIVASDEVGTRTVAAKMISDEKLRSCVDIIGLHYTTYGDENTEKLFNDFNKEIWYSEGAAPSNVPELTYKKNLSGISGRNAMIDIANRIINGWYHGKMTMYEFQPAVSAYYDGSCYYPKQLIKANEPWSGYFEIDSGFYMAMHFTRFIGENWHPVSGACFGDGSENHYIENTSRNYITLMPEDGSDFTQIFTNDSSEWRIFHVNLLNCDFSGKALSFAETAAPDFGKSYNSAWFRLREKKVINGSSFEVRVKPFSVLTVTTMNSEFVNGIETPAGVLSPVHARLTLPYKDDFAYSCEENDFAERRGGAPLFTTDQGGAFELERHGGTYSLVQKITEDIIPENWRFRGTPSPITCLGDDSWANYSAKITVEFGSGNENNYVGLGVRYNSAVACEVTSNCGAALKLFPDGRWEMLFMDNVAAKGIIRDFSPSAKHIISVSAVGNLYIGYVDGKMAGSFNEQSEMQANGRISLLSGYFRNSFSNLEISPIPSMNKYVTVCDAFESAIIYSGNAVLNPMDTYKFSNRTSAALSKDAGFELEYSGCGFALCGTSGKSVIRIEFDGKIISDSKQTGSSQYRQAFYRFDSCGFGRHHLKVTVLQGILTLDSVLIYADSDEFAKFYIPTEVLEKAFPKSSAVRKTTVAAAVAAGAAGLLIMRNFLKNKKKRS